MKNKLLIFIPFIFIITGCSSTQEEIRQVNEEVATTDPIKKTDFVNPVQEGITEPAEIMHDWNSFTPEEKILIINQCIEYKKVKQEAKNEPVDIIGTPEQFVSVIDERYEEIEAMEGSEKYRMQQSLIVAQVSIMGHKKNLIEFSF